MYLFHTKYGLHIICLETPAFNSIKIGGYQVSSVYSLLLERGGAPHHMISENLFAFSQLDHFVFITSWDVL